LRIHTETDNLEFKQPVVAVGTFDGVHRGHQFVINKVKERARESGGESVVVTFQPHPRIFLNSGNFSYKILNTHLDKVDRFYKMGIDHLVVLHFDRELASMTGEEFIRQILMKKIRIRHLVLGYDNKIGTDKLRSQKAIGAIA